MIAIGKGVMFHSFDDVRLAGSAFICYEPYGVYLKGLVPVGMN